MNPEEPLDLQKLSLLDRHLILLYLLRLHARHLRPAQLLIPTALLQMLLFAVVMLTTGQISILVIGNAVIVAAAIVPSRLVHRPLVTKIGG